MESGENYSRRKLITYSVKRVIWAKNGLSKLLELPKNLSNVLREKNVEIFAYLINILDHETTSLVHFCWHIYHVQNFISSFVAISDVIFIFEVWSFRVGWYWTVCDMKVFRHFPYTKHIKCKNFAILSLKLIMTNM